MSDYTVILAYPGTEETIMEHVAADNPRQAAEQVRQQIGDEHAPVIAVIPGWVSDVYPHKTYVR